MSCEAVSSTVEIPQIYIIDSDGAWTLVYSIASISINLIP